MNESTIYLTGSAGFEAAVVASLGRGWSHEVLNIGPDLTRFELPEGMTSKRFKNLVGEDTISNHNIMVFYDLNVSSPLTMDVILFPVKKMIRYVAGITYRKVKELAANSTISYLLLGGR